MSWFESVLGEYLVTKFWFSRPAKAGLGNDLTALIETGRFQMYHNQDEHTTNSPAGAGFWEQVQGVLDETQAQLLRIIGDKDEDVTATVKAIFLLASRAAEARYGVLEAAEVIGERIEAVVGGDAKKSSG